MKRMLFLISMFTFSLFAGQKSALAQQYYGPPQFTYEQHEAEEAWERRGFQDGMEGAERDLGNHRQPNVNNREEYRDPDNVPHWARHEYREGFRHGYYRRMRQIYYRSDDGYRYWRDPR